MGIKSFKSLSCLTLLILLIIGILAYKFDDYLVKKHRDFIFCQLIHANMSRTEVNKALAVVGPFLDTDKTVYMDNLTRVQIVFVDRITSHLSGGYAILGYSEDKLVVRYVNTSLSDRYLICQEDRDRIYQ